MWKKQLLMHHESTSRSICKINIRFVILFKQWIYLMFLIQVSHKTTTENFTLYDNSIVQDNTLKSHQQSYMVLKQSCFANHIKNYLYKHTTRYLFLIITWSLLKFAMICLSVKLQRNDTIMLSLHDWECCISRSINVSIHWQH